MVYLTIEERGNPTLIAVSYTHLDVYKRQDVGGVGESVAVDALQLQKQIVSAGIPVADGLAVMKQAVGQVADGGVVPGVIVGAVGGDPLVIGPGDLPLGGGRCV